MARWSEGGWKKLLRMARDCHILHMPMEWINDNATGVSEHFLIWYINHITTVTTVFQLHTADSDTNKMGHPIHYHHDVRVYLYYSFPECWIGCRKNCCVPHMINWFNPTWFFLGGGMSFRGAVYGTKPATLQELWQETEHSCTSVPAANLVAAC
jgi:hypothetical protein